MTGERIPNSIGRYRVERQIGAGGMGVVYLAEDTKLRRRVALKLLPDAVAEDPERLARFEREARTAAKVNHPNLATIHDLEQCGARCFIVMEYIEGKTLAEILRESGPLPVADCLDVAVRVAEGLAAAHECGIVHRDLKPRNVMVTGTGQVKILDFGLAKALEDDRGTTTNGLTGSLELTSAGRILGTANYMSPEQARGYPVDARSDLFSFGCVLYEMATGTAPFERATAADTLSALLHDEPPPLSDLNPESPPAAVELVDKLMAKDPRDRYQSTQAVLEDLRRLSQEMQSRQVARSPSGPEARNSIAVLPFLNMSADPENEYFSDGLAEELINALAHVEGLDVASRTSAFQFKGKALDVRTIGRELGVESVLEGSVRKAGNRVRITAQLIKVADGYHLWSERYDRELQDVFVVQDEIAQTIVDTLKSKVIGPRRAPTLKRYTENAEAYNLYLKGRYFWNKRYLGQIHKSVECFQRAIETDPTYALAYTGLADAYSILSLYGFCHPGEGFGKARAAAFKALEIDETLAEAHFSLAVVRLWLDLDYEKALESFDRALELNPGHADAHCWRGHALCILGRRQEGITAGKRSQELEPLSPVIHVMVALQFYLGRRFEEAFAQSRRAAEIDSDHPAALWIEGTIFMGMGRYAEAVHPFERAAAATERHAFYLGMLGAALGASRRLDEARKVLGELKGRAGKQYVGPLYQAWVHVGLGETDEARRMFEAAARDGNVFVWSPEDPLFDAVRAEPAFHRALDHGGSRKRRDT